MNRVSTGCILFDNVLTSSYDLIGTAINFDSPIYIGGDPWRAGAKGAKFDNIQVFNKSLTLG